MSKADGKKLIMKEDGKCNMFAGRITSENKNGTGEVDRRSRETYSSSEEEKRPVKYARRDPRTKGARAVLKRRETIRGRQGVRLKRDDIWSAWEEEIWKANRRYFFRDIGRWRYSDSQRLDQIDG